MTLRFAQLEEYVPVKSVFVRGRRQTGTNEIP